MFIKNIQLQILGGAGEKEEGEGGGAAEEDCGAGGQTGQTGGGEESQVRNHTCFWLYHRQGKSIFKQVLNFF